MKVTLTIIAQPLAFLCKKPFSSQGSDAAIKKTQRGFALIIALVLSLWLVRLWPVSVFEPLGYN